MSFDKVDNGNSVAENNKIINDNFANIGDSVHYIIGNTSGTAGIWTGTDESITEYYEGLPILYKIGIAGSSSGTTLNINGLGAITVRRNTSSLTTQLPVNTVVLLTYTTISNTGYFVWADYDANTLAYQVRKNQIGYKPISALYRYQLLFTVDEIYMTPLNNVSNSTGTSKKMVTQEFNPYAPIYYYSSTSTVSASGNIGASTLYSQTTINLGYSLNSGSTLTAYKAVYLVVQPTTGCLCKLATAVNPWSQTLPTSDDGYLYIYLGQAYNSSSIELSPTHPVFFYKDGALQVGSPSISSTGTSVTGISSIKQTTTSTADSGTNVITATLTDGTTSTFNIKNGSAGTSVSISSTSITYQASTSGTTIPTGTWSTSIPSVTKGQYLWSKTVVTYSNGTSTTTYNVAYQGTDATYTLPSASQTTLGGIKVYVDSDGYLNINT
jgi:hypothetical protein